MMEIVANNAYTNRDVCQMNLWNYLYAIILLVQDAKSGLSLSELIFRLFENLICN